MSDKIAIISDVHGNVPALEVVLEDIRQRGIERIFNLGDLVGKGGTSDRAIDICREVCEVTVLGNWDDDIVRHREEGGVWWSFVRRQIGEDRLAYLASLPYSYDFWLSGMPVRLYHASAKGLKHRVYARSPYEEHVAMFENTENTGLDGHVPQVVGYGDIHDAFTLTLFPGHKTLFNAGSVGNPLDIPLATYVILNGKMDSRKRGSFSLETIRLEYDVEGAIRDAIDANAPEIEELALELRTGVYRAVLKKQREREAQEREAQKGEVNV